MNTFGKTLVVCNMVAAIAVAVLFALSHYRSINWKRGYDELSDSYKVSKLNQATDLKDNSGLMQDVKAEKNKTEAAIRDKEELKTKLEGDMIAKNFEFDEEKRKRVRADVDLEKVQNELATVRIENQAMATSLKESEKTKATLDKTATEYHKKWEEARSQLAISVQRSQNLLEIIRQKDKALQDIIARGGSGGPFNNTTITRGPNDPNPPSTRVRGTIEKIDRRPLEGGTGTLIQLSVGIDHGVNKDNTLDVYRLQPRPEYLGMIRIVESFPTKSVGRIMKQATSSPLREFDIVVDNVATFIGDR